MRVVLALFVVVLAFAVAVGAAFFALAPTPVQQVPPSSPVLRPGNGDESIEADNLRAELRAARNENDALRSEVVALKDEIRAVLQMLQEESEKGDAKPEKKSAALDRPDTAAERRTLAIAQRYLNDIAFLGPDDLTSGERKMLGGYARQLSMVRRGDRIGLFGVFGDGKNLRDVEEPLDEWVEAYAAVSTHYQVETDRVITDLVARGQVDEFDDKVAASNFESEARATYQEQYGEEHPGFEYRWIDGTGRVQLVDRDRLLADPVVAELSQLRTDIGARLGEGSEAGGVMEKWVETVPDGE